VVKGQQPEPKIRCHGLMLGRSSCFKFGQLKHCIATSLLSRSSGARKFQQAPVVSWFGSDHGVDLALLNLQQRRRIQRTSSNCQLLLHAHHMQRWIVYTAYSRLMGAALRPGRVYLMSRPRSTLRRGCERATGRQRPPCLLPVHLPKLDLAFAFLSPRFPS
jgi:hypothetical protein